MGIAASKLAAIAVILSVGAALAGPGGAGHGHGDETAYGKAGEFDFSCLIPGHREAGMTGKIIVK